MLILKVFAIFIGLLNAIMVLSIVMSEKVDKAKWIGLIFYILPNTAISFIMVFWLLGGVVQ